MHRREQYAAMIRAILTDIEGTTTSLSFVKDVLFPYSRARLAAFVQTHRHEPAVRQQLDETRRLASVATDDQAVDQLIRWIDEDKKITPLKALQGMIWEAGYRARDFTGHVYPDVAPNLKKWKDSGRNLYVFSSGSVQAQKLIFGYSDAGDLTSLFSGYFDTTIGNKREAAAYRTIAQEIGLAPKEILFLSDISEELDAAQAAGMQTTQLVRGAETAPSERYRQVHSFNELNM